jgi:membrane-associated phospholipid phosphatase
MSKRSFVLVYLTVLFILITDLHAQSLDTRIFRSINDHHTKFSDNFFSFQSNSVKPVYIGAPLGFLVTGIIQKDRKAEDTGVLLAVSAVLNLGVTYGMKNAVNRKRPYKALDNVHTVGSTERSASFPSGHTSSAFTVATMVSLQYPKWYVIVPSFAWAGLAGYSRMAIGMHYPSDVLMGAVVGAGSAYLIYKLRKPIIKTKDKVFR